VGTKAGSEQIDCNSEYKKPGIPAADKMRAEIYDACYRDTEKLVRVPLMLPSQMFAGDGKSKTTLKANDEVTQMYMSARKSMGHVYSGDGKRGSGFFLSKDGAFATDYHVVGDASTFKIKTDDGHLHNASVIAVDEKNDVALMQVQKLSLKEKFNPVSLKPFDPSSSGEYFLSCGFGSTEKLHCSPGKFKTLTRQKDLNFPDPPAFLDPNRELIQLRQHSARGDSGGLIFSAQDRSVSMLVGMSDDSPNAPGSMTIGIPAQRLLELQDELRKRNLSPIERLFDGFKNR
jgi:S1-C subfamily serine protease